MTPLPTLNRQRFELVMARLWDVNWTGDGFGKHGRGPFATKAQAVACIAAVGWPGTAEQVRCQVSRKDLDRILRKATRRIVWPGHVQDPVMWAEVTRYGTWSRGFCEGFEDPGAGCRVGPYSFGAWHGALTDAMHWGYNPHSYVPPGWRRDDEAMRGVTP